MKNIFSRFITDDSGASVIEYGIIAAVLGLGIVVGMSQFRNSVNDLYSNIYNGLNN